MDSFPFFIFLTISINFMDVKHKIIYNQKKLCYTCNIMKNYIVFDLEWNQSPTGRDCASPRLSFEIFEIGAVKLNEKFEKVSEFHRLIKPCVYRQMHHIISEVGVINISPFSQVQSLIFFVVADTIILGTLLPI